MYKNRSSTCLVFFPVPKRVAIDLPAVLSVWAITLIFFANFDSSNIERNEQCFQTLLVQSHTAPASPEDSASVP